MSNNEKLIPEREAPPPPNQFKANLEIQIIELTSYPMDEQERTLARQSHLEFIIAATDYKVGPPPDENATDAEAARIRQERDEYMKKLGAGRGLTLNEIKAEEEAVRWLVNNGLGIVQDTISNPDGSLISTFSSFSTSNSDISEDDDHSSKNDEVDANGSVEKQKFGGDQD
uniref:Uncharacterized protein n=1 Tax=Panagrolaimus davidi TaxID=227884 RepID=A0A914Q4R0_9BILA